MPLKLKRQNGLGAPGINFKYVAQMFFNNAPEEEMDCGDE